MLFKNYFINQKKVITCALGAFFLGSLLLIIPSNVNADPVTTLVINEIDYDQPSTDTAEFVEIKNTSNDAINLDSYELRVINGSSVTLAKTVDLPDTNLSSSDYFIVCNNSTNVANCDFVVTPDTGWIQNGAPDAVALFKRDPLGDILIDNVSYEGNVPGYVEGVGIAAPGDDGNGVKGLSRYPDGQDTNSNFSDFVLSCITPGGANVNYPDCSNPPVVADCGDGIVTNPPEVCDINTPSQVCTTQDGYRGEVTCGQSCLWNDYCYPIDSCGDGILNGPEQCDDGNMVNGDNCNTACQLELGIINAFEFRDDNKNQLPDPGEPATPWYDVALYQGNDCSGNPISTKTYENFVGDYAIFDSLSPGNYSVKETLPNDGTVINTTPLCQNIAINSNQTSQVNFGNFRVQQIIVCVSNDLNGDGIWQSGEPRLPDWTINLAGPENLSAVTGGDGCTRHNINIYGGYEVTEVLKPGWIQTFPSSPQTAFVDAQMSSGLQIYNHYVGICGDNVMDVSEQCDDGNVNNGDGCSHVCNLESGKITGFKFYDRNNNNKWDGFQKREFKMNGWKIFLDTNSNKKFDKGERATFTNGWRFLPLGQYSFDKVSTGTYQVCEVMFYGWRSTLSERNNCQSVTVGAGENKTNINFANRFGF